MTTATAAVTSPAITGYRDAHRPLLRGHWLPGELLAAPLPGRPAFAEPLEIAASGQSAAERLYVVPGTAFVRYTELDWIHRHARLEIGLSDGAAEAAGPVLARALALGF